jgi:hypothetical protein
LIQKKNIMQYPLLKYFAAFTLLLLPAVRAAAQVTIGADLPPTNGALLDLRTQATTTDGVTANKGLLLPRVDLVNAPISDNWSTADSLNYIGLNVYNVNATAPYDCGVYVWNRKRWEPVGAEDNKAWLLGGNSATDPSKDFLGTTDNTSLVFRTNNKEQMRLDDQGRLAVGTTTVDSTLTVNGTAQIRDSLFVDYIPAAIAAPGKVYAPLALDKNGQLVKAQQEGETATYHYITSYLKGANGGLLVRNFNTQIDTLNYTLLVVGSAFLSDNGQTLIMRSAITPSDTTHYNPLVVFANHEYMNSNGQIDNSRKAPGSWIIHADYINGEIANNTTGYWELHCMVINNVLLQNLPSRTIVNGNNTFSDTASPI